MSGPVRVIKLGGSLLDWPELSASFRRWVELQPPAADVVIVGGGAIVDALRRLDGAHPLPAATSHWLAIRAMSVTAAMAAELLSEAALVASLEQLRLSPFAGVQILDVEKFMRDDAATRDPLPTTWEVTSDSIAARVATAIGAQELVLLKSALPAAATTREALSRSGLVDPYFPGAARGLAVRCVNLREPELAAILLD